MFPSPKSSRFFLEDWTITLPSQPHLQFIRLIPKRYPSMISFSSNPLNDPSNTNPKPWSEEDTQAKIKKFTNSYTDAKSKHNNLVILVEEDEKVIGMGLIEEIEPRLANIGLALDESGRGRGVGKALMKLLLRLSNEMDVDIVEAGTMKPNKAMRGLMRSLGMEESEETKVVDGRVVADIMFKNLDRKKWKDLDIEIRFLGFVD